MGHDDADVDAVRRLYEAYNCRDLDAWAGAFHADAVWTNVPTGEEYVGPGGQRENYRAWDTPFPEGRCVDLRLGGGAGLVVAEFTGDGVNSGPLPTPDGPLPPTGKRVAVPFCDVHELADGLIVRTRRYWDQATAVAQLGL